MSVFYSTVFAGCIAVVFSVLFTFFVTTVSNKEKMDGIINTKISKNIDMHNAINHQVPVPELIDNHENDCPARNEIAEVKESITIMRIALIFLVRKAGGEPKDLGLK